MDQFGDGVALSQLKSWMSSQKFGGEEEEDPSDVEGLVWRAS